MSKVFLHMHLGLGDHFIDHGIVREYAKKYDRVGIFSKPQNYATVAFMFRDLKNIVIMQGDDNAAKSFIFWNKFRFGASRYDVIKVIGFEKLNRTSGVQFEKQFYAIADVPFEKKWESFYVDRDRAVEEKFISDFAPKTAFAFIHDDAARGMAIKIEKINPSLSQFRADKKYSRNMIDYCGLLEKADEIHVIDSSFMFLVDCLMYSNPKQKLYVHRYARANDEWTLPILKKNWIILTQ